MHIHELNYILCIAKHRNLTKAAQELYISQPTLSKYLQKLERELGGKLFSKTGNTYIPTYLGRQYMDYARKMLEVHHQWTQELGDITSCNQGQLNIAFPPNRSACLMPRVMPEFHRLYPGVKVNLYEEASGIQEKLLEDDGLDFAIFNAGEPHPKLSYELLGREELLLMLPPDSPHHACAHRESGRKYPWIDLTLLDSEPFILSFPDQTAGRTAAGLFAQKGMEPNVVLYTRNLQTGGQLCRQGLGACFIQERYLALLPGAEDDCYSIGPEGIYSSLALAYRKDRYLPAYARQFIALCRSSMEE